jgi:hypothetical protein
MDDMKLTFKGFIRKIVKLIEDPNHHCTYSLYRDKNDDRCMINQAHKYCIEGAANKIMDDYPDTSSNDYYYDYLYSLAKNILVVESIPFYNDSTSHEEIIETLRKIGWNTTH